MLLSLLTPTYVSSTTLVSRGVGSFQGSYYAFPANISYSRRGGLSEVLNGFLTGRQFRSSFTRSRTQRGTLTWSLLAKDISRDEYDEIFAQWESTLGGSLPFSWTPPPPDDGLGGIMVRFVGDELRARQKVGGFWDVEIEFEEVA